MKLKADWIYGLLVVKRFFVRTLCVSSVQSPRRHSLFQTRGTGLPAPAPRHRTELSEEQENRGDSGQEQNRGHREPVEQLLCPYPRDFSVKPEVVGADCY
jgi:hypothetical protein